MTGPAVMLLGPAGPQHLSAAAAWALAVLSVHTTPVPAAAGHARLEAVRVTEIVDRAARWAPQWTILGVAALDDAYVDAAALVADLLDLPSPGLRAAGACGHDFLRRHYLPPPADEQTGAVFTVDSVSVGGTVRRIGVRPPTPHRRRLTDAHTAVLARLDFGTGMARAEYRLDDGHPAVLTGISACPPRDADPDEVIGVSLGRISLRAGPAGP